MTERQLNLIAAQFKFKRDGLEPEKQNIVDSLAIDVANAINVSSTNLDRDGFLFACGHPEYQKRGSGHGVTKN